MPAQFVVNAPPSGLNRTQKRFTLDGTVNLTGNYTNGSVIPIVFTNALKGNGQPYLMPTTYNGLGGVWVNVPVYAVIPTVAGYSLFYDTVNKGFRIYNGTTELASSALPAALTAGFPARFEFLNG